MYMKLKTKIRLEIAHGMCDSRDDDVDGKTIVKHILPILMRGRGLGTIHS
jgi:hypothetical protein